MQPERERKRKEQVVRITLYIAGSARGDGTCSFSPLLQEPLYFLLLRPTANPLARPITFSTPAYRFPFHAAPCRFLPCFHRVIPIFLRRCRPPPPPPPPCILREYNIQEGRKRKFVQRRERPMAEEAEGVGFVKYGKGCGQEAEKYYEYIAIFRPLTSLWRENVKQAGLDS